MPKYGFLLEIAMIFVSPRGFLFLLTIILFSGKVDIFYPEVVLTSTSGYIRTYLEVQPSCFGR